MLINRTERSNFEWKLFFIISQDDNNRKLIKEISNLYHNLFLETGENKFRFGELYCNRLLENKPFSSTEDLISDLHFHKSSFYNYRKDVLDKLYKMIYPK